MLFGRLFERITARVCEHFRQHPGGKFRLTVDFHAPPGADKPLAWKLVDPERDEFEGGKTNST